MSLDSQDVMPTPDWTHHYPASHWNEISRFITGNERDPRDLFCLAEDVWDAWPYAAHGVPSKPGPFRFHFGHLRSFLKPYIKWYCFERLLVSNGVLTTYMTMLPYAFTRTDSYLIEHHYDSPDTITLESDFRALWNAQLLPQARDDGAASRAMTRLQVHTHSFWKHLRMHFGFPLVLPPTAPYETLRLTDSAYNEQQVIPYAVINQFAKKLALHREGRERLGRFHHLRLCVLMLNFALGRRITEILTAPRGAGSDGPLTYYPARGGDSRGALWFQFSPNKHGPQNRVHVSREWEDVVTYCVRELIRYSDEVRDAAPPEIRDYLILISRWNFTSGIRGAQALPREDMEDIGTSEQDLSAQSKTQAQKDATVLSYDALQMWLHGHFHDKGRKIPGITERWKITADGSADGEIYQLRTHQARHTRQSAIASDPRIPLLSRQRDLNHLDRNMQAHYQHNARQQNETLLEKARKGQLAGPAMEWFATIFGTDYF